MSARSASATPASVGVRRRLKLLLLVVGLFMSWAGYTVFAQEQEKADRIRELREVERQLQEVRETNAALRREIERLNDPEYIGQIARQQGMGLPGEQPIRIERADPERAER